MKTVTTFAAKFSFFASTALLGLATLVQPAPAFADRIPSYTTEEVSAGAPSSGLMGTMYETEALKLRLHLANPQKTKVKVEVRNSKNQLMFGEWFRAPMYSRTLDLASMPEGTYSIKAGNRQEGISRTFTVQTTVSRSIMTQALEQKSESGMIAAIYEGAPLEMKVKVAAPAGDKTSLVIRDRQNKVVFRKLETGETVIKTLRLANLEDGNYTLEVSNENGKTSRPFTIATTTTRTFAWQNEKAPHNASAAGN